MLLFIENHTKIQKIFIRIITICLIIIPFFQTSFSVSAYTAGGELDSKLATLSQELDQIKKKKQQIEEQIQIQSSTQNTLASQISLYDNRISSIQLTIDEKKNTIESLETQIAITQTKIVEKQKIISDLETKINSLNQIYTERVKVNFQDSFSTPFENILQGDTFETYMIQKELSNSLAQENQKLEDELSTNIAQVNEEKLSLAADLKSQQDNQDQIKAETLDLGSQEDGLNLQKNQKSVLLAQSQNYQSTLQKQKSDLEKLSTEKQKEMDAYLLQIISVRGNGASVHKGDAIGKMGRSGYVLNCNGDYCYYPDPDKEPCGGAHLHLEVAKKYTDGKYYRTNPLSYVQTGIVGPPLRSFSFTQYYQGSDGTYGSFVGFDKYGNFSHSVSGHPGIDIVGDSNCGTPIYAGADGVISYYCRPFQWPGYRADPTFFAVLYDPVHDINITYMHLQKAPGACS